MGLDRQAQARHRGDARGVAGGSQCHLLGAHETLGRLDAAHASLLDASGKNAFASEDPEGTPLLRHAIAGMQATIGDAFLIFAPNANSYRRFKANSYAPVAPTWGVNNRTVSFRVTAGAAKSGTPRRRSRRWAVTLWRQIEAEPPGRNRSPLR